MVLQINKKIISYFILYFKITLPVVSIHKKKAPQYPIYVIPATKDSRQVVMPRIN